MSQLSTEQQEAIRMVKKGGFKTLRIGGLAGTGKSHVAKLLGGRKLAFTGKAALNFGGQTIHSTIYEYDELRRIFVKRERIHAKLLVVDEASMIGQKLHEDLLSFNIPIVYLGDYGQLPPVSDDDFNLMEESQLDFKLTQNFRSDDPVVEQAMKARNGEKLLYHRLTDRVLLAADQILCGFNVTRDILNQRVRRLKNHLSIKPIKGEKMICLKNNRNLGIMNGQTFKWGEMPKDIHCDYGYAISVHKAQGSEWGKVLIVDDGFGHNTPEYRRRWMYTAITRAKKAVMICQS